MTGASDTVRLERCIAGRLRNAYPVSAHDVEIRLAEDLSADRLTEALDRATRSVFGGDPRCRRVVFAAQADDLGVVAAAEAAGFRYVVDVDIPGAELSLLVAEPAWVTATSLDRVPGT